MSNTPYKKVKIDHLIDTIGPKEDKNTSLAVLMGAGMSVTAGIPLASEIVKNIREKYPNKVKDLKSDEKAAYQKHMKKLFRAERQKLIRDYTDPDKVKINWAHIFLAQLIKEKVVDRVMTVNFDNLLAQALAWFGIYPAIYDFAASQYFDVGSIYDPSIFHLHGQMEGFKILNTEEETEEQKESDGFKGLFEDTKTNRALLVIGYSGSSDPVFEKLAKQSYNNGLYWIGYKDNLPSKEVLENILTKDDCHLISGYTADSFFDELRNKLGCELPGFASKPFSHMKDTFYQKIADLEKTDKKTNPLDTSIKWVSQAIEEFEKKKKVEKNKQDEIKKDTLTQEAKKIWLDENYDKLESFYSSNKEKLNETGKEYISYAFNEWGVALSDQKKYSEAIEQYQKAIQIKPDDADAYQNLLETILVTNNKLSFFKILQEIRSNCTEISSSDENIIQGLELLAGIRWEQISNDSVNQFYKNLPGNNPPDGWEFDTLVRFYKQIKSAEIKQQVRLVLDAWQGKITPEQFHTEASSWIPDS